MKYTDKLKTKETGCQEFGFDPQTEYCVDGPGTDTCQVDIIISCIHFNTRFCECSLHFENFQGDSGGPLLTKDENNEWVQIGITGLGGMCGDLGVKSLGTYTKVAAYLDWIHYVIAKTSLIPTFPPMNAFPIPETTKTAPLTTINNAV